MEFFFKRVNRGLVLGAVLLIGLAVFIWQDESSFQKLTPAIGNAVTSYMEAVGKLNTFDADFQKIGATMTKAQQTNKLQEITKTIDQYWVEANTQNGILKSSLMEQMKNMVAENSKGKGYIQKFSVKLHGTPIIDKLGPGSASVAACYTAVLEYAGSPTVCFRQFAEPISHFCGGGKEGSPNAAAAATRKRFTFDIQTKAELEHTGGTWKIVSMSGGYSNNSQPVTVTIE